VRSLPHGQHRTPLKITSRSHPLFKELRELRDTPHSDLLFLEGPKLVDEALRASIPIKTLVLSTDFKDPNGLVNRARPKTKDLIEVSDSIFRSLSDLVEPQGVIAIGERPRWTWESILAKAPAPIIILDGLQNPGNVAAIVRTAEAAGTAGVVTTPTTARLTSPKALRGAMGSVLRVPSLEHQPIAEIARRLAENHYTLYGASQGAEEGESYTAVDWKKPAAILLGQEGSGLSMEWEPFPCVGVRIPMESSVESLNVGAAAAVLLYEARRQREAK
jgi:TrmH family RNA methyltransferase